MSDTTELLDPRLQPCSSKAELAKWVTDHTGLRLPSVPVCPGHATPLDYLWASYHEPTADLVVWAPRGGGKTRLAALATLMDLLHKPGVGVRILGGSMAQSLRLWDHLESDGESLIPELHTLIKRGRLRLTNKSHAQAIPHSQRSVRGMHIQKLRCDELELFDPAVFEAAKLTTRSLPLPDGRTARGTIECLSTLHQPWGLMQKVVEAAEAAGRRVIKWCILDVLEKCPPDRPCDGCPLWDECRGRAKDADGFVPIDDAIQKKSRVSRETWEAEMLCLRPSVRGAVFPTFSMETHVREMAPAGEVTLGIDFGFAAPFVCLWIADDGTDVYVFDEHVQDQMQLEAHLNVIEAKPYGQVRLVSCDPAGNARSDQTAQSNIDVLTQRKYIVRSTGSKIVDGLELIRTGLRTGDGRTTLFVHPRCQRLIRALQSYHYAPGRQDEEPVKDGEHDHLIDALRYFYVNRYRAKRNKVTVRQY